MKETLLQMEEVSWKAQVAKLQLWTSVIQSQQDLSVFNQSVTEFEGIKANLISTSTASMVASLGRFRSTIVRAATVAVDSIYSAITCRENKSSTPLSSLFVVSGYKEVWDLTEASSKQLLLYNLFTLKDSLSQHSIDVSDASIIDVTEWTAIKSLLDLLLQSIHKHASALGVSVFRAHEVVIHDLMAQIDDTLQSSSSSSLCCSNHLQSISGESSLPIIAMLKECHQFVMDIQLGSQLCGVLLYHLLSSSIQV